MEKAMLCNNAFFTGILKSHGGIYLIFFLKYMDTDAISWSQPNLW